MNMCTQTLILLFLLTYTKGEGINLLPNNCVQSSHPVLKLQNETSVQEKTNLLYNVLDVLDYYQELKNLGFEFVDNGLVETTFINCLTHGKLFPITSVFKIKPGNATIH